MHKQWLMARLIILYLIGLCASNFAMEQYADLSEQRIFSSSLQMTRESNFHFQLESYLANNVRNSANEHDFFQRFIQKSATLDDICTLKPNHQNHFVPEMVDPKYNYQIIDIDNPKSIGLLEDAQMQLYHTMYLQGQIEALKFEKDRNNQYYKEEWFDFDKKRAYERRESFIERLIQSYESNHSQLQPEELRTQCKQNQKPRPCGHAAKKELKYERKSNPHDPRVQIGYRYLHHTLAREVQPCMAQFISKDENRNKKLNVAQHPIMQEIATAHKEFNLAALLEQLHTSSKCLQESNFFSSVHHNDYYYLQSRYLSWLLKIFSDPAFKGLLAIYKAQNLGQAKKIYNSFKQDIYHWNDKEHNQSQYIAKLDDQQKQLLLASAQKIYESRLDYQPSADLELQTFQEPPSKEVFDTFSYVQEMQALEHAITQVVATKQQESFIFNEQLKGLEHLGIKDPASYAQATMNFIEHMERHGMLNKHIDTEFEVLQEGFQSFYENLKIENPLNDPKAFLQDACNVGLWSAANYFGPGWLAVIQKAVSIPEQVYALCTATKDYAHLSPKQQARLFGKAMADVLKTAITDKAITKFRTKVFKKPSKKVETVIGKFKRGTESKQPSSTQSTDQTHASQSQQNPHTEVVTPDGTKVQVQAVDELVHLQENAGGQKSEVSIDKKLSIQLLENKTNYVSKTINGKTFLEVQHPVIDSIKTGSALKLDPHHAFDSKIDNFVRYASKFSLQGNDGICREFYQLEGSLDGVNGVFEWILDPRPEKGVTHRLFIKDGTITGKPNMIPKK